MSNTLEEKLREASHLGDLEGIQSMITQDVDINSRNHINGWTALHWACKRNNEDVVRLLLNNGANPNLENNKGEKPVNLSTTPSIQLLLGDNNTSNNTTMYEEKNIKFTPSYLRNPILNGQVDIGPRLRGRHTDFSSLPTTMLPAQSDDLILKVKVAGSTDPDYIEIEVPRWKLTYANLLHICCEELDIKENQVERIRKLPNTRLRKDSDVKRLTDLQSLEIVLKTTGDKARKLFDQHQRPITKLNLLKKQLFKLNDSNEENQLILEYLDKLAEVLNAVKVDRRCGRTIIYWLNEENLGVAKKIVGSIFNFHGYQNFRGHFLLPEEVLYLLEKNRIELFWNNLPVSMEQAFTMQLQAISLVRYRAYKKLVQQGIKVVRNGKAVEPPMKKLKSDEGEAVMNKSKKQFKDIFVNLQKNGPRMDDTIFCTNYDFKINVPAGGCFNYKYTEDEFLNTKFAFNERNVPLITSFPTDGFPCYKLTSTETVSLA